MLNRRHFLAGALTATGYTGSHSGWRLLQRGECGGGWLVVLRFAIDRLSLIVTDEKRLSCSQ